MSGASSGGQSLRRLLPVLALVALVVLAGCGESDAADSGPDLPPDDGTARPDPDSDVIGWEQGYWHNESIEVDQSDGLSESELDAYVARAMARVEVIRQREFTEWVPVSVESRAEYRNRSSGGGGSEAYDEWNDQVWEALLIIGEQRGANEEIGETRGSSVQGFYSPSRDEIRIVTDSPDSPVIDNATLVHELTHALQDQYVDLGAERFGGDTQDEQLATSGLIEGEASYVERKYAQRCGVSWRCVRPPDRGGSGGGGGGGPNLGVLLTQYQPYSDGPVYVAHLREEGGWAAVEDAYDEPPASTEQVIHRTDESPAPLQLADRATGGWEAFPEQGVDGRDTVGEASIFAMFWYQSREYGAAAVDVRALGDVSSPLDVYDYRATPSSGWANDKVLPYRNGEEGGYVWKTRWDSTTDAEEFRNAYVGVLEAHNTTQVGEQTWVIEDGEFADAFHVSRSGDTVTIVNGPTVDDLSEIRPGIDTGGDPGGSGLAGFGPLAAGLALAIAVGIGVLAVALRRGGPVRP